MSAREPSSSLSFSSGERWGTVDDVAEMLAMSRDFVYQHAAELGGRKLGTGPKAPWRFRLEDVLAATSCPVRRESVAATPASERHLTRQVATVSELLPIQVGRRRG
jgi:hypothetical protein